MAKGTIKPILLAMASAVVLSGAAQAQSFDELEWFVTVRDLNKYTKEATLNFAVPETDFVMASAWCRSSFGLGDVAIGLQLAADLDLETAENGQPVYFRFDPSFSQENYNALAVIPESGEGLYGVALEVPAADPLWQSMKMEGSMTYLVGMEDDTMTLPLTGTYHVIDEFLKVCTS